MSSINDWVIWVYINSPLTVGLAGEVALSMIIGLASLGSHLGFGSSSKRVLKSQLVCIRIQPFFLSLTTNELGIRKNVLEV